MKRTCLVLVALGTSALWSGAALAQDPAPAPASVETPKAQAAAAPAAGSTEAAEPKVSVALERLAGFAYATISASDTDASVSATVFNVGAITVNPYGAPRLGVDFGVGSNVFLGGAVGFTSVSGSTKEGSQSQDIGNVTLYTLTPRIGYRIPVSPSFDIVPRAGVTLAGGSATLADNNDKLSVFTAAISIEGLAVLRATDSFNFLGGLAFDRTISGTATSESRSGTTTQSSDVKGALTSLQLWLGLGGYL